MKKILLIFILGLVFMVAPPVLAADKPAQSKTIYLYSGNLTKWTPSGSLTYNVSSSTFNFTFTGKAPIGNDWYALVLGPHPYLHSENTVIIDYPRSNDAGDITVSKSIELNRNLKNMQVWLVWAHDIGTDGRYTTITEWTGWHPKYYLFGTCLVNYNDSDISI
jgi:hypothetical protein